MLYTQKDKIVLYVREHWHEWLWIFISEGEAIPHFYLPTHRVIDRYGVIVWIIPLAPFVLLYMALRAGFLIFWRDCVYMIQRWQNIRRLPESAKEQIK